MTLKKKYILMSVTKWSQPLIDILVDNGILAEDFSTESIITTKPLTVVGGSLGRYNVVDPYTAPVVYPEGGRTVTLSPTLAAPFGAPESTTGNRFLGNGMPIESNFEVICRENLGVTEEKKWWSKELKAAVKEYGHDDVLEAFYNWSINQGTFLGKKPVTMFLKNIGSYIGSIQKTPTFTNPAVSRVEQQIAYVTENRVFFSGDFRIRLAKLISDFGEEIVLTAFTDFYQDVEDRNIQWASRNFLERANVMIAIIQKKRSEAAQQQQLLNAALTQAAQNVDVIEEEDEL